MTKKLLFLCFCISTFSYGQYNQDAPWIENAKGKTSSTAKGTQTEMRMDDLSNAFNAYWEKKDKTIKGSGHKPFKRWQNYWEHYTDKNGNLPSTKQYLDSWAKSRDDRQPTNSIGNWTSIGPINQTAFDGQLPGQGRINAVAVDPNNANIWYAGAPAGGIWKSVNAGASWTNLFDEYPQIGVSGIAITPNDSNTILITTGDDDAGDSFSIGIFKSTDGGNTWNTTSINPSNTNNTYSMNEITFDPSDASIAWAASNFGLHKSTDGGQNWTVALNEAVKDFKLKPGDGNTVYAVTRDKLYKTIDGANFSEVTSTVLPETSGRMVLGVSAADANVVYVLSAKTSADDYEFQGLYKSTDSGETFIASGTSQNIMESPQAWFDLALEVSPTNANTIYVGCLNIWKSSNGGTSFSKLNNWALNNQAYTHADIHTIKIFNDDIFVGSDGGIYTSTDEGLTFNDHNSNMAVSQFYRLSIAKNNSTKMVGGLQDNGGHVFNNSTWNTYHGGDGMDNAIDPNNSNIVYGFTQYGGSLSISTNSGQSIGYVGPPKNETTSEDIEGNWITPMAVSADGSLYAGFDVIYKLVGNDWIKQSNFVGFGNVDDIETDPFDANILYAVNEGTIYKSIDAGVTFAEHATVTGGISDLSINSSNTNILYATTSSRIGSYEANQPFNRGVFKIADDGTTVTVENITYNLASDQAFFSIAHQGRNSKNPIYVGTSFGIYYLDDTTVDDNGDPAWQNYYNGIPSVAVSDLEISLDDNKIIASTYGRGIWESPIPLEIPQTEVRLLSLSPTNNLIFCGEIIPEVSVENKGQSNITSIEVTYTLNNANAESFVWTGDIAPNESAIITFNALNNVNFGANTLAVSVTTAGDSYADNNTASTSFFNNTFGVGNSSNTFETEEDSLIVYSEPSTATVWERGTPAGTLLNTTTSGTSAYATVLNGNHPDNVKSFLVTECYEMATITNPVLSFKMAYILEENWDIMYVEYTTDNGASWHVLGSTDSQPNWYNSNRTNAISGTEDDCQNCPGAQWTGTASDFATYSYDFTANAALGENDLTNEDNVIFRFVFHSDAAVNEEGVVIDDITMEGLQDDDDDDNDGILDVNDNCPLNANSNQLDTDNDGIGDACDTDDDNDGVLDTDDNCPLIANADQADADGDGIGDVCDDDMDNDGVPNSEDNCPNTPEGAVIDVNGCPVFSLPVDNFSIISTGETCRSSNNGSIAITATENLQYTATITGNNTTATSDFTANTTFSDLASGSYTVCITIASQPSYENCFTVLISQPEDLAVSAKINSLDNNVTLSLQGGSIYTIELNGAIYSTAESSITLPLNKTENSITVKTDRVCQGIYEETIIVSNDVFIYPNPIASGNLKVVIGETTSTTAYIQLFQIDGSRVFGKEFVINSGKIEFNVDALRTGIYILNVKADNKTTSFKIIRK